MRKFRCANRSGSNRVGLPRRLRANEPVGERGEGDGADGDEEADVATALLPHEDAEHDAAHADDGQNRADQVDLSRSGVGDVLDQTDLGQDDEDDDDLEPEADPPRQVGGDEAAEERADGGGDRRRGADQRVGLLLGRARKLPWMSDCMAGSSSEAPRPPTMAQKMMTAVRLWASVIAKAPTAYANRPIT